MRGAVSNFFFFWNFWRWYLLERSHENPGEEGSALCEKFLSSPLSMMDKGEARTVTICTQTDRRASLSHWFDRSRIDPIQSRGFFVLEEEREREREREGRKVSFEERNVVVTEDWRAQVRRASGRCISVITERDPIRGGRPPLFPSCNTFLTRVHALPPTFLHPLLHPPLLIQRYSLVHQETLIENFDTTISWYISQ